jgi:hypothetical protein
MINICLVAIILLVSAMYSQGMTPDEEQKVLDKVHRNVHFEQYMKALEKFNDYKKTSTHVLTAKGGVEETIQIRSGSGDMTAAIDHEKYCLKVRIGVVDLAEPDKAALSQAEAPAEWVTAENAEHCTTTYPGDPWDLKLKFGPLAIGHAFVVQTTVKSITVDNIDYELTPDGMYKEDLRKLSEEGSLKLDYEMMENDLRNNIKLGGRRLYLLIENGDEGPAPVEEDTKNAESDVLSTAEVVDGAPKEDAVESVAGEQQKVVPKEGEEPVAGEQQKVVTKEGEEPVADAQTVETKAEEPPVDSEEQASIDA